MIPLLGTLERWESAVAIWRRPTPEEFCRDTPEDLPAFRKLLDQLGAAGLVTASGPAIIDSSTSNFQAGRYTAYDYHAEGGLGVVYRAKDEELNRTVALKCMKGAGSAASPIGQRFLLEAEITSILDFEGCLRDYQKTNQILDQMKANKIPLRPDDVITQRLLNENLPFVKALPKAIESLEEATKQPTSVRMNALRIRITCLLKAGRFDEAIETANRMAEKKALNGNAFGLAAVEFDRLAIENKTKAKEHAAHSLGLLRKATQASYFGGADDIAWLKWETFFDKVREDPAFALLLKELEKK